MIKLPNEAPNALVALCQQLYDHKSTGSSVAQDVWQDCLEELRLNATAQPVSAPEWTNEQCLEFLSIAFRHANISGDIEMDDIRLGIRMVNAAVSEKK
ncbi:hypothetical protein [Pantoea ananatis]